MPVHHSPICPSHSPSCRRQAPSLARRPYRTSQFKWSQYCILNNPPKRPCLSPRSLFRTDLPLSPWFDLPPIHCPTGVLLQPHMQGFAGNPTTPQSSLSPLAHRHLLISSHLPHLLPPSCLLPLLSPSPTVYDIPIFHHANPNSATSKSQSLPSVSSVSRFYSILVRLFRSLPR